MKHKILQRVKYIKQRNTIKDYPVAEKDTITISSIKTDANIEEELGNPCKKQLKHSTNNKYNSTAPVYPLQGELE